MRISDWSSDVCSSDLVLTHDKLVEETDVAFHIATTQAQLARSAVFTSRAITLSGALVRNDTNAVLAGEGGDCTLDGLYLLHGRDRKRVVSGKSVSVSVDHGGRRIIKKKNTKKQ